MVVFPQQLDFEPDYDVVAADDPHTKEQEGDDDNRPPADLDSPPPYIPLRSFEDRYSVVSDLGSGSFGDVCLAKSKSSLSQPSKFSDFKGTLMERTPDYPYENIQNKKNRLVAIKIMNKRLKLLNDYTRVKEVRFILALPYHPNLVQIYELFIDSKRFRLHIAMECMDQNLYQLMKSRKNRRFSDNSLKSILSQILNGMRHIHRRGYFHRDIKPENILVSLSSGFYDTKFYNTTESRKHRESFVVKLADFGLAREVTNRRPYTAYVSTRWYRSPEILLRQGHYSRPVDIWAFGCVAAEVAMFRPLFPGDNELDQIWKVFHFLGTPSRINQFDPNTYSPYYGYWDDASLLFPRVEIFSIPDAEAVDITHLIRATSLNDLCDTIRLCLKWDPSKRASVDELCQMSYFKGTCVDDYPSSSYGNQHYHPITQRQPINNQISMEQCGKLAGIGSSKLLNTTPAHLQLRDEHQHYQDVTDFGTLGSSVSPNGSDPISSFLKGESTPYDNGGLLNQSDFGLGQSFQSFQGFSPHQAVPMLTPDEGDIFPNNENENFITTPLDNELTDQFRKSLNLQTPTFPSYIDPSLGSGKFGLPNFSFSDQQSTNAELIKMDLNVDYHPHQGYSDRHNVPQHYLDHSPSKNFASGLSNMYSNNFDGVMFQRDSVDYSPNYDSQNDSNNAFFANYEQETDSFQSHPPMRDMNFGDSYVEDSAEGFSEALYSKFNLRKQIHESGEPSEHVDDFDENQFTHYD